MSPHELEEVCKSRTLLVPVLSTAEIFFSNVSSAVKTGYSGYITTSKLFPLRYPRSKMLLKVQELGDHIHVI